MATKNSNDKIQCTRKAQAYIKPNQTSSNTERGCVSFCHLGHNLCEISLACLPRKTIAVWVTLCVCVDDDGDNAGGTGNGNNVNDGQWNCFWHVSLSLCSVLRFLCYCWIFRWQSLTQTNVKRNIFAQFMYAHARFGRIIVKSFLWSYCGCISIHLMSELV